MLLSVVLLQSDLLLSVISPHLDLSLSVLLLQCDLFLPVLLLQSDLFLCWCVLLLLHIVGQGPAVLAAGAEWMGYFFHLSSLSNVPSFGRRLNMTEILWFQLLNPNGVVRYCRGRPCLALVNRLERLSLPRNSALLTDRLDMTSLLTGP